MRLARLLVSALFAVGCVRAEGLPDLGDAAQSDFSPLQERRVGDEVMRSIRNSGALLDDPEIDQYLNGLGYRLLKDTPTGGQDFQFFVIRDRTLNAFALPGGYIGVHTGLIATARTESELASVLAHEIGHVTQRHLARMVAAQKQSTIPSLAAMAAAILAASYNPQLANAALTAVQAGAVQRQINFTREHEREADRIGLQILHSAKFDVHAMPEFFERLQRFNRFYDNNAPAYLRTHPLTTERIADIENRLLTLPYRQVTDSLDFQLLRAKLHASDGTPLQAVKFFEENPLNFGFPEVKRYGLTSALLRASQIERAAQEFARLAPDMPPNP
ncbi:MAG: M48 family metallopeptidase, partial [Burkholderiales bacterium]